jgi:HPt (histidine-containing phosphotransfer) domain-containing protein
MIGLISMGSDSFDTRRLYRMTRGHPDTIREVIDLFVEDTERNLQRLRKAIDEEDDPTAMETAHALKGSAANMGAERLSELFQSVEEKVKSGDFSGARTMMRPLVEEFRALQHTFADFDPHRESGND